MMLEEKYIEKIRSKISKSSKIKNWFMYDNFDALILSAGLSTRMGKTKALLSTSKKSLHALVYDNF